MAHKIICSTPALQDLKQISDYISNTSVAYANSTTAKIVKAVRSLDMFPRMGRKVPEFDRDELREILVLRWRIVYEVSDYDIEILRIIHGAQRWRE
jgi:plasmid stabilization system protein ParE